MILNIDLPDPTDSELLHPATPARIGLGAAGPRYRTQQQVRFAADHAVTQDALYRRVESALLDQFDLFSVDTQAPNREVYLQRPELGRALSDAARATLQAQCLHAPEVQIVVSDGLSADAVQHNLAVLLPALMHALAALRLGTTFFVRNARVGLMNEIGALLDAQLVILLIGERPGLGRADSLSAYLGYCPRPGRTDAHREVICNIHAGGMPPGAAVSQIVDVAKRMLREQRSGAGSISSGRAPADAGVSPSAVGCVATDAEHCASQAHRCVTS